MTKAEREARDAAVRAVDRMGIAPEPDPCAGWYPAHDRDGLARALGMRPLKPPPGSIAERTVSAARWALEADRRAGVVDRPTPTKTRDKVEPRDSWFEDHDS